MTDHLLELARRLATDLAPMLAETSGEKRDAMLESATRFVRGELAMITDDGFTVDIGLLEFRHALANINAGTIAG